MNISFNTFNDAFLEIKQNVKSNRSNSNTIIIKKNMRNGKKCTTTVEGLDDDVDDMKELLKIFKKKLSTNGVILTDEDDKKIIQVQGDKRKDISNYLIENDICAEERIQIYGT